MEFLQLRDGPLVPVEALTLAVSLEFRGYRLSVDGETLRLRPADSEPAADALTESDRSAIRQWKSHLIGLALYNVDGFSWAPIPRKQIVKRGRKS